MLVREVTYKEGGFTRLTFDNGSFRLVDSDGMDNTCFLVDQDFVSRREAMGRFESTLDDLALSGVRAATDTGYIA